MPVALVEFPSALETIVIVAVGAVVVLLGAFVTWVAVTSALSGLNRLVRRR